MIFNYLNYIHLNLHVYYSISSALKTLYVEYIYVYMRNILMCMCLIIIEHKGFPIMI